MNTESFVLYESVYKQCQILEKKLGSEIALKFINAVMQFGLYGEIPEEDDDIWLYGLEQTITSISSAKDRHNKAIENGKSGGRKKIELDEAEVRSKYADLHTWKAVASYYGVDEDTLRKIRSSWEKTEKPKNDSEKAEKTEKPKNLNVNVNVNGNDNGKVSVFPLEKRSTAADAHEQQKLIF